MSPTILQQIKKGEQDAKAAERAKKRGAAAGRGSRSKSSFQRSAGRAAIAKSKINGRGCSMDAHKNSRGFSGRLKYVSDPKKNAELIFANGDLRSMRACARLRPDIKEPCAHFSIALPPQAGKLTRENWEAIIQTARQALGLDDSFPLVAYAHHDTPHQHVHFVASRISIFGKCHDQTNIGLKCAAIERILESKHGLKLVPPSEYKNKDNKLTKGEIEMSVRTRQHPPRMQIACALKIAVQGKPTVRQFVERLNAAGVGVKASIAGTGKMNGFSFTYGGIAFGGSKIAREFGWQQLQERLDYDHQARDDSEFLRELDGTTGSASGDASTAVAIIDGLDRRPTHGT